jgi:hypothetical protein
VLSRRIAEVIMDRNVMRKVLVGVILCAVVVSGVGVCVLIVLDFFAEQRARERSSQFRRYQEWVPRFGDKFWSRVSTSPTRTDLLMLAFMLSSANEPSFDKVSLKNIRPCRIPADVDGFVVVRGASPDVRRIVNLCLPLCCKHGRVPLVLMDNRGDASGGGADSLKSVYDALGLAKRTTRCVLEADVRTERIETRDYSEDGTVRGWPWSLSRDRITCRLAVRVDGREVFTDRFVAEDKALPETIKILQNTQGGRTVDAGDYKIAERCVAVHVERLVCPELMSSYAPLDPGEHEHVWWYLRPVCVKILLDPGKLKPDDLREQPDELRELQLKLSGREREYLAYLMGTIAGVDGSADSTIP